MSTKKQEGRQDFSSTSRFSFYCFIEPQIHDLHYCLKLTWSFTSSFLFNYWGCGFGYWSHFFVEKCSSNFSVSFMFVLIYIWFGFVPSLSISVGTRSLWLDVFYNCNSCRPSSYCWFAEAMQFSRSRRHRFLCIGGFKCLCWVVGILSYVWSSLSSRKSIH